MAAVNMIQNHAYAIALHVVSVFEPMFAREEERSEAFRECFNAVKAGLETYEMLMERMQTRICRPSTN